MGLDRLTEFEEDILKVLEDGKPRKASEIAKALNANKKTVNSALYNGKLNSLCFQDTKYYWHIKNLNSESQKIETKDYDDKLSRLCNYYLNCIGLEGTSSVSAYQESKFDLSYCEMQDSNLDGENNPKAMDFLRNNIKSKDKSLCFGYPILSKTHYSIKNSTHYRILMPIFIIKIIFDESVPHFSNEIILNQEVINCYSTGDNASAIYELLSLENELGLNAAGQESDLDEIVSRLKMIRPNWDWHEEIDFGNYSKGIALEQINEDGIYNKAAIFKYDKENYTVGLESELSELSKISTDRLKGTALYNILYDEYEISSFDDTEEEQQILEVLPLNIEQKDAIHSALTKDITIITGPPGTGKSQVVSDLIINMILANKSVLFSSKNNKAVDVVNTRVNEIGNVPVMVKIGGSVSPSELIRNLQTLIDYHAKDDEDEFYTKLNEYNNITDRYKELENNKSQIIDIRNKTDFAEKEFCEVRERYSKYWDNIDEIDTKKLIKLNSTYIDSSKKSNYDEQNFFTKLLWPLIRKQRANKYQVAYNNLCSYLKEIDAESEFLSDDSSIIIDDTSLFDFSNALDKLQDYKQNLKFLNESEPIESIDLKLFSLSKELSDRAYNLWNAYLRNRASKITRKEKSQMVDYVTTLNLMSGFKGALTGKLSARFKEIQRDAIRFFPCLSITSLSLKDRIPLIPGIFDLLIVDEASQCDIASMLPLLYRAKRVAIIGDKMQLSHISKLTKIQDTKLIEDYGIELKWSYSQWSFYDLGFSNANIENIVDLRDHHRSHNDIIAFSNNEYYDGKLRVATDYSKLIVPSNGEPGIRWIKCDGVIEKPKNGSFINRRECDEILNELQNLIDRGYKGSIGVVTPFRAQADLIRTELTKKTQLYQALMDNSILVDTVHKFQGDERDLMIFSTVVSNNTPDSAIGFLESTGNLFNVAITRARSVLIVVGDESYCASCKVGYLSRFAKYVSSLASKKAKSETSEIKDYGANYPNISSSDVVSDWEVILYEELYRNGIITVPQYPEDKYKLDLALFLGDRKLDIEVDGEAYHRDWNGELCYRDKLRNQRLFELGWDVKRFWVYQIRDQLPMCVDYIKKWIDKNK